MIDWLNIDSAPKDGSKILGYFPKENKHGIEAFCHECYAVIFWDLFFNKWSLANVSGYEYDVDFEYSSGPTHYAILTKPD